MPDNPQSAFDEATGSSFSDEMGLTNGALGKIAGQEASGQNQPTKETVNISNQPAQPQPVTNAFTEAPVSLQTSAFGPTEPTFEPQPAITPVPEQKAPLTPETPSVKPSEQQAAATPTPSATDSHIMDFNRAVQDAQTVFPTSGITDNKVSFLPSTKPSYYSDYVPPSLTKARGKWQPIEDTTGAGAAGREVAEKLAPSAAGGAAAIAAFPIGAEVGALTGNPYVALGLGTLNSLAVGLGWHGLTAKIQRGLQKKFSTPEALEEYDRARKIDAMLHPNYVNSASLAAAIPEMVSGKAETQIVGKMAAKYLAQAPITSTIQIENAMKRAALLSKPAEAVGGMKAFGLMQGGSAISQNVALKPGETEIPVAPEVIKGIAQGGALHLLPAAKSVLGQLTGKPVLDSLGLAVSGHLYDYLFRNQPLNLDKIADETGQNIPAFFLMNAIPMMIGKIPVRTPAIQPFENPHDAFTEAIRAQEKPQVQTVGTPTESAQKIADVTQAHVEKTGIAIPVQVHANAESMAQATGGATKAMAGKPETGAPAAYDPNTGTIHIDASHPDVTPESIPAIIAHEGVAHMGARKALGDEKFNQFTTQLANQLTGSEFRAIKEQWGFKNGKDLAQNVGEEHLATIAEKAELGGVWRGIMDKVVTAYNKVMRSLGATRDYSDAEIREVLRAGRKSAQQAPESGKAIEAPKFTPRHDESKIPQKFRPRVTSIQDEVATKFPAEDVVKSATDDVMSHDPKDWSYRRQIGVIDGKKIMLVNGRSINSERRMDFGQGDNYEHDRRTDKGRLGIPKYEVWLDARNPYADHGHVLVHELTELEIMRDTNGEYDKDHPMANMAEREFMQRQNAQQQPGEIRYMAGKKEAPKEEAEKATEEKITRKLTPDTTASFTYGQTAQEKENAAGIRENQGQLPQEGQVSETGQNNSGQNLQQPTSGTQPGILDQEARKQEGQAAVAPQLGTENAPDLTGVKRSMIDKERARLGLQPIETPAQQSERDMIAERSKSPEAIFSASTRASKIVEDVNIKARTLTPEEVEDLQVYKRSLNNHRNDLWAKIDSAATSPEEKEMARREAEANMDAIDAYGRAVRAAGSKWGATGHAMQQEIKTDYSLENLLRRRQLDVGGRRLTEAEERSVRETSAKLEEAQRKLDEIQAKNQSSQDRAVDKAFVEGITVAMRNAEREIQSRLSKAEKEARGPAIDSRIMAQAEKIVSSLEKRAEAAHTRLRERLGRASAGVDPTIIIDLSEIAAARIARTSLTFAEWSGEIAKEYGERFNDYLKQAWVTANLIPEIYSKKSRTVI